MFDIEKAEERKEMLRLKREKEDKRQMELNSMSWIKRMQEPENKERLEQLQIHQEEAFEKMIKREAKHLLPEWKELFSMFFRDLLDEKVKNMRIWFDNYN